MSITIMVGDVRARLREIPDNSIHCCVTSPPYWGLRDYGVDGQIGLESSPAEFIETMVEVFEEVRRVLRPDGTCWVNMGDSYATNGGAHGGRTDNQCGVGAKRTHDAGGGDQNARRVPIGFKPKDLCMMPHRLAIALQDAGWYVRQDIVWAKPNPMPESVRDRCTKSHEYIFLLTKSERYYYNADAIREECVKGAAGSEFHTGKTGEHQLGRASTKPRGVGFGHGTDAKDRGRGRVTVPSGWASGVDRKHVELAGNFTKSRAGISKPDYEERKWDDRTDGISRPPMTMTERVYNPLGRNKRSVWTMATHSFPEAHFATFPPELPETCIKAGWTPGGVVFDPFFGAGTTGLVCDRLQVDCVGIELSPAYAKMSFNRIKKESTLLCDIKIIGIEETAACPL